MNPLLDDDINPDAMKTEQIRRLIRMRAHDKEIQRRSMMNETIEITQEFHRTLYAEEEYEATFTRYLEVVPHIQMGVVSILLRAYATRLAVEKLWEVGLDADAVMAKATDFYTSLGEDEKYEKKNRSYFHHNLIFPKKGEAFQFVHPPFFAGQQDNTWPAELLELKQALFEFHYKRVIDKIGPLNTGSDYADADDEILSMSTAVRNHSMEWAVEFQKQFGAFHRAIDWAISTLSADQHDTTRAAINAVILREHAQGLARCDDFAETLKTYMNKWLVPLEAGLTEENWLRTTTVYRKDLAKQAAMEARNQPAVEPPPLPAPVEEPKGLWASLRKKFKP